MYHHVTHPFYLRPSYLRMQILEILGQLICRLPNHLQMFDKTKEYDGVAYNCFI